VLLLCQGRARAARSRPEGAPPAHLALTASRHTRFSKRFATEGATRLFYPLATRRLAIDAPKVAALLSRFAGIATRLKRRKAAPGDVAAGTGY